jgi:KDO2-lipid IV(A) lauroyltransferase
VNAPLLPFFGKPAHTPVSAAEWAAKYDALLVPIFGLREPDGMSFRIHVEEPIHHGEPEDMMQRYNDVVEAVVRDNIDQCFWIHRCWKHKHDGKLEI